MPSQSTMDATTNARWGEIAQQIREQIQSGELKEGDRIPSEFEIADRYGVSRQTAHRAVAELKRIGLVLRQRRTGTVVASPPSTKNGLVALVMDHTNDFPQTDLVRGIRAELGDDYKLLLCDVGEDPHQEVEQLRRLSEQVDGILMYPLSYDENTPMLRRLIGQGFPLVLLDRIPVGLEADAVISDNYDATSAVMRMLTEDGHRRIAFLSGDNAHVSTVRDRHAAYLAELESIGSNCQDLARWYSKDLETRPERLVQAVFDSLFTMLHRENPPTAVFCSQDCYAMAALEALHQLEADDRVVIATFNDWPPMMLRRADALYRVVQKANEIGRGGAELLLRRLRGERSPFEVRTIASEVARAKPISFSPRPFGSGERSNGGPS